MSRLSRFASRYLHAAAGSAWALTLGLPSQRNRDLIHHIARHFGHDDLPPRQLPTVRVADLTRDDTAVTLPEPLGVDGNVTLLELLVLARLVRERQPRAIFEIGTFDGRTTLALAANAPDDAIVYTLDLPAGEQAELGLAPVERKYVDKPASGARLIGQPAAHKVRQLLGDSARFDFAPYRAELVFVDASHAYEYVINDSRRALDLIGDTRGVIAWHDYGAWEGVTRALNELRATDPRFAALQWVEGTTLAVLRT